MKNIIFLLSVCCLVCSCASRKSLVVREKKFFGETNVSLAKAFATHWRELYGCDKRVVLCPLRTDSAEVIEETIPGRISYAGGKDIKSIVLHSMTHACKPEKATMLEKPFLLGQDTVIGFHGLNLVVRTKEGKKTFFTKIEEGVAERAAIFAGLGYTSYSKNYANLATLTKNYFPKFCVPEPVEFVKTNDVYGFVAEFLKKEKDKIEPKDIVTVVGLYQKAWDYEGLIPEKFYYE